MTTGATLPDYIRPGLDIVFVGINPGSYSASVGKYFATPRNRFWRAFNLSGIVGAGRRFGPGDEAQLPSLGVGFTDVVKRATSSASSLRAADFRRWAPETRDKLLDAAPLIVCFNGLTGYKWFRQYSDSPAEPDRSAGAPAPWKSARLGEQPDPLGQSRVFVAPNPSPANASYSLDDIAGWLRRLAALRDSLKSARND